MSQVRTLAQALFANLPIPAMARRNIYVERALQERRAAATALECMQANLLCLAAELDTLDGGSETARRTLETMRELVSDMEKNLAYDEVEVGMAGEEI